MAMIIKSYSFSMLYAIINDEEKRNLISYLFKEILYNGIIGKEITINIQTELQFIHKRLCDEINEIKSKVDFIGELKS